MGKLFSVKQRLNFSKASRASAPNLHMKITIVLISSIPLELEKEVQVAVEASLQLSSTVESPYSTTPVKISELLAAQSQELYLLSFHKLEDEGRWEDSPGVQCVLSTGTYKISVC